MRGYTCMHYQTWVSEDRGILLSKICAHLGFRYWISLMDIMLREADTNYYLTIHFWSGCIKNKAIAFILVTNWFYYHKAIHTSLPEMFCTSYEHQNLYLMWLSIILIDICINHSCMISNLRIRGFPGMYAFFLSHRCIYYWIMQFFCSNWAAPGATFQWS